MNWPFRRRTRAAIQVIPSTSMRLSDWTASPDLVRAAQRLFASHEFQTILAILRNESPSNFGISLGSTHDDQIAHAYKATGYNLCVSTLESFATPRTERAPLEATFEPEPEHPLPPDAPVLYPPSPDRPRVEPAILADNPAPVDHL